MTTDTEELKKISKQIEHLSREVSIIKFTLIGNQEFSQKGVVQQVEEHAKYIAEDKTWKNRIWGAAIVIGIIWQPIYDFIKNLISHG